MKERRHFLFSFIFAFFFSLFIFVQRMESGEWRMENWEILKFIYTSLVSFFRSISLLFNADGPFYLVFEFPWVLRVFFFSCVPVSVCMNMNTNTNTNRNMYNVYITYYIVVNYFSIYYILSTRIHLFIHSFTINHLKFTIYHEFIQKESF